MVRHVPFQLVIRCAIIEALHNRDNSDKRHAKINARAGKTNTIYAYAVPKVSISEELGAVRDSQGCSPSTTCSVIMQVKG